MKKSATAGTHFNARVVECRLAAKVCLSNFDRGPGQTIATCQRNISQHCWPQHVVGSNLTIIKLEPTTSNMSQHITTQRPNARNMLHLAMLLYVALTCWVCLAGT